MRYLSVCSGIEAATVAWHHMGWEPVGFSEIEAFPSQVLKHHYPDVPNFGDLNRHEEWPIEPGTVDVLVGGTPCQSFSVAGLRKGLSDPRGNLALVYLSLLDRLRPRWCVWENVPGVLSSSGGRDFGSFLGALAELGYQFAYRVLDAQYFGVAQRRRRVFVVGHLGDWSGPAEVLSFLDGMQRHPAPRRQTGTRASRDAEVRARSCIGFDRAQVTHPENRSRPEPGAPMGTLSKTSQAFVAREVAPPLLARAGSGGGTKQYETCADTVESRVVQPNGSHWDDPANAHPTQACRRRAALQGARQLDGRAGDALDRRADPDGRRREEERSQALT